MKTIKSIYVSGSLLLLALTSGCAHGHRDKDVNEDVSSRTHKVSIGDPEVRQGDHVDIFRETCTIQKKILRREAIDVRKCVRTKIGEGVVSEINSPDHSQVVFNEGVPFEPDLVFEKVKQHGAKE